MGLLVLKGSEPNAWHTCVPYRSRGSRWGIPIGPHALTRGVPAHSGSHWYQVTLVASVPLLWCVLCVFVWNYVVFASVLSICA
jgi:hypothetical protein